MAKDKILKPFLGIIAPENKFTVDTIDDLKSRNYLTIGDIVEVLGYYTAGDGAHHKRKIESADDGSGVQLANGLWANIVHNGEVCYSMFGATRELVDTSVFLKTHNYCNKNNINLKCVRKFKIVATNAAKINTSCDFNNSELVITDANYNASLISVSYEDNPFAIVYSGSDLIFKEESYQTTISGLVIEGEKVVHIKDKNAFCKRYLHGTYRDTFRAQIFKSDCYGNLLGSQIYPFDGAELEIRVRDYPVVETVIQNLTINISIDYPLTDIISVIKVNKDRVTLDNVNVIQSTFINPGSLTHAGDVISFGTSVDCKIVNSYGKLETHSSVSVYSLINSCVTNFSIENCKYDGTWGAHQSEHSAYIKVDKSTMNRLDSHNYGAFFSVENSKVKEISLGNYHRKLHVSNSEVLSIRERSDYSIGINSNFSLKNSTLGELRFRTYTGGEVSEFEWDFKKNFHADNCEVVGYGIIFYDGDKPVLRKNKLFSKIQFSNCTLHEVVLSTNSSTISKEDLEDVFVVFDNVVFKKKIPISTGNFKAGGRKIVRNSTLTLSKPVYFDIYNCDVSFDSSGWLYPFEKEITIADSRIDITDLVSSEKKLNISKLSNISSYNSVIDSRNEIFEIVRLGQPKEDAGSFTNCRLSEKFMANYTDPYFLLNVNEGGFFPSNDKTEFCNILKKPSLTTLDTPYHTTKMQQLGIYDDFISYMDSQHEYDKEQKALESAKQEAYQLALAENSELVYEDWLASYPELMPVHQEPVPSERLMEFYNEYK